MPSYPFTPNIPLGSQNPSSSASQFNANFTSTSSLVNVDLYGFNNNNGGFHQMSTYVVQGSDPTPSNTYGAQAIEYAKLAHSNPELFLNRYGVTGDPVQLSSGRVIVGSAFSGGGAAVGQTFLPGGLQLKWGTASVSSGNSVTITYTSVGLTAFPVKALTAWVTGWNTSATFNITTVTQTTITIGAANGSNGLWFALGA